MAQDKFRKRLDTLFAEIDRLANHPEQDGENIRRELDELRARIQALEADFRHDEPDDTPPMPAPSTPARLILYEKEQVGYAFTESRLEPLKAETLANLNVENSLRASIVETDHSIGAVMAESSPERVWAPDDAALAEAIARQASLQIQNLRLLSTAERARAEAQSATRRFMHESWQEYLDAIHQREHIAFSYDQAAVQSVDVVLPNEVDYLQSVDVMEEQVGRLYLKADPAHPITDDDKAMVAAIARQVGQQVENLRLLADASRARAQADETLRRIARENWQAFASDRDESALAYLYDTVQVLPLDQVPPVQDITFTEQLMVQGEAIGQLALAGLQDISPDQKEFLAAIAERMSSHIETLRLNDELRRRAIELQELDRLKSSFLANMSHELRTPLNAILGFSDVMLEGIDGELTDYMENDLRLIQKNGQHLLHLINDVLDMAKIEAGRMNLHPEKFMLRELFEDVISITSSLAHEKRLLLVIEPDSADEVELMADITRIRQVMINLVNNAIKFTEVGQISLRVEKIEQIASVLITVKDTGLGIPPEHLEKIFQEFAQVDTSTTRKAGGTGLGLPISRRLVEMHGGRMWAESTGLAGEGSTLFVELPIEARITDVIEKQVK